MYLIGIRGVWTVRKDRTVDLSSDEVKEKLEKLLGKYSLPTKTNIDSLTLYKFITLDKKRSGDYLSIIYVDKIGTCEIKKILLTDIKKYL